MRIFGRALVLGMELGTDEEGMRRQLHDLHETCLGIASGSHHSVLLKFVQILGIEFVAVAVTFVLLLQI